MVYFMRFINLFCICRNHHKGQYKQRSSTVNDSVERKRAESTSNDKVLQPGNDRLLLLSNDDGKYRSIPPVKLHSDEARVLFIFPPQIIVSFESF